ncbi:MAG: hypothetical protein HN916_13835 [Anaerolineae bacterium]|jgi:hypothetical protein|nr:hypothetical protein [Anaerolineae bacterium]MBT7992005.1 hypothetical protein [Anaerolineae bacterium]
MRKNKIIYVIVLLLILSLACSLGSTPSVEAPPTEMPGVESSAAESEATSPESDPSGANPDISAAGAPAMPDCNLLDVAALNAISSEDFAFKTQDQLGNCYYQSQNYMLTIGGGQTTDAASANENFIKVFGKLPGATWESYPEGFQLGTASASTGITAQGVSASGHALVIMVVGHPDGPKEAVIQLAVESARQLNAQWAQ